jgi:hypothetical protein
MQQQPQQQMRQQQVLLAMMNWMQEWPGAAETSSSRDQQQWMWLHHGTAASSVQVQSNQGSAMHTPYGAYSAVCKPDQLLRLRRYRCMFVQCVLCA